MLTRAGHILWIVVMAFWLIAGAPMHHHPNALHGHGPAELSKARLDASSCSPTTSGQSQICHEQADSESRSSETSERDCSVCHLIDSTLALITIPPALPTAEMVAELPTLEPDVLTGVDQFLISRGRGPPATSLAL